MLTAKSLDEVYTHKIVRMNGKEIPKSHRELQLAELETEYMIILAELIEYAQKELGQSIARNKVPKNFRGDWRIFGKKITVPKSVAIQKGYRDNKFTEVRGQVYLKFHIFEEYETEINGEANIVFMITPILNNSAKPYTKTKENPAKKYGDLVKDEVRRYFRTISKDEYFDLVDKIGLYGMVEIPIRAPKGIGTTKLNQYRRSSPKFFRGIVDFRQPHLNSPVRKKGSNLYVLIKTLDF